MRKAMVYSIVLSMLLCSCGMKVYIQGVDVDWIKQREWDKVIIGAVSSVATHEIAHYAAAQAKGLHPKFESPTCVSYDKDDVWVDRAGFVVQLGIGALLNTIPATKDSDFTLAWNAVSAAQLLTYDLRNDSDQSDFSPNRMANKQDTWRFFTGVAMINTGWSITNQGYGE